jgi:hypothetical protein
VDYVSSRRRARSAAPLRSPDIEEANYITGKIDSRGRIGEAYHGATKDWAIVDVPPGTERIRMDGVGGASTDTTFSKYSGVRRTKFIPEGQDAIEPRKPSPTREKDRTSVTVYDREREVDIERTVERRTPRPAKSKDMWTEISKDLVSREAIEYMGYEYEDTPMFFYIMDYLRYVSLLTLLRGGNYVADLERRTMCSTWQNWRRTCVAGGKAEFARLSGSTIGEMSGNVTVTITIITTIARTMMSDGSSERSSMTAAGLTIVKQMDDELPCCIAG